MPFAGTAVRRWRRLYALGGRGHWPPSAAGRAGVHRRECRRLAAETKGDRTPGMVSCPLLTPLTFLCADTSEMCSETGLRGLGSVRLSAYGWLLCPEFPLRKPPRITVRGHPVQGGGVPLRKAPLRSSAVSWSTRRHCGPLAFRRATEGSRVLRKGWGVKRGRETLVSLPLLPPPPGGGNATPCHGEHPPAREGQSRLRRQAAGTAEPLTLC